MPNDAGSGTNDMATVVSELMWENGLDSFSIAFRPHADEWMVLATGKNGKQYGAKAAGASEAVAAMLGTVKA